MNLTYSKSTSSSPVLTNFTITVGDRQYKIAEPEHDVIDLFRRYKKNGYVLDASGHSLIPFHAITKITIDR